MTKDDMGYEKRVTAGTMGDRKGYSILFTKENVDKLLKKGGITSEDPKELAKQDMKRQQVASKVKAAINVSSANERTKFSVQIEGEQRKYSVHSFKDWKEGTFEELYNLGHANVTKDEWERLTSAGVSAGIDLALRIVSHFFGTEIGVATARQMEYPYPQNDQRMYI
jgi:hypothetical protein